MTITTDVTFERLVLLDQRIDANESDGMRARWEFGHQMLVARDGAGRLPNGYLTALVERTGKSRAELKFRAHFAATYSEDELATAVANFSSWRDLRVSLKQQKDADDNTVTEPPVVPDGKFSTFVVDPPWQYGNTSTRGAADNHYDTMTIEELCNLDVVPTRTADQAHLYLWTTAGHLPEAFGVMTAWGFRYKTYLVWVKPQMGMGNYFRVSTELVLFGVRGDMRTRHRGLKNYFEAKRGKHSAKPPYFNDLVQQASPGLFLEEKSAGVAPHEGQRRALKLLATLPGVTVVFFRPGVQSDYQVLIFDSSGTRGWQSCSRLQWFAWLRQWALEADTNHIRRLGEVHQ